MNPLNLSILRNFVFIMSTSYFKIGKLAASHGLDGTLVLEHSLGKKTLLEGLKTLFIESPKDNFLPYFIESTRVKNDSQVYIKLEGIETKEVARKLTPKTVWLPEKDFKKYTSPAAPIALLDFTIMNGKETLGTVLEVIEQPHQVLCAIEYKGKEALIPVHEQTLVKMDAKNKILYVNLPEGLLEIFE